MKFASKLAQTIDLEALSNAELAQIYAAKLHALQSGVAAAIANDPHYDPADPPRFIKHLRTGLDARAADAAGLARLLIDKGVITEREYHLAMADAMAREVEDYEAKLTALHGRPVTLG